MWRPPNATKHPLPILRAPSRAEAETARLFQPISVGPLYLATRTWVPAMVPWRASEDGFVTPRVLAWYERFAEGRPGAVVVEATGIRDIKSGPLLRIGHNRYEEGLRSLVDTVRRASGGETKVFIQLIDFLSIRRRPTREKFLLQHLVITERHRALTQQHDDTEVRRALLSMEDELLYEILSPREREDLNIGARERIGDETLPHIRELPQVLPELFAKAAQRAERAGFDGVELHYAHAYTMASFLSARNTRKDGYGTTREGRVRLPCEVLAAVKACVSANFVVGVRLLSDEIISGGSDVADASFFSCALASKGAHFLSLSRGGKFEDAKAPKVGQAAYPYTGPSGWECMPTVVADEYGPFGRNVAPAKVIRSELRTAGLTTPVVVAGGITTFAQAEAILADGAADIIGAARQSLADPDWFLKLRLGQGHEIRRCTFTNYCEGLDQMHRAVTCKLWDREALSEPALDLEDGRRLIAPPWIRNGVRS